MNRFTAVLLVAWSAALLVQTGAQTQSILPGVPLAGLTPLEFSEFRLGLEDFTEVEAAEEGLGPAFNGTSCAVCHSLPAIGGGGVILELRAGYREETGDTRGLNPADDTLIHMLSVPNHGCRRRSARRERGARRAPIRCSAPAGRAIPDDALLALEDPSDRIATASADARRW